MVEQSGWGWEMFGVRTVGKTGHVYARAPLDYEDPAQRRGFRFMLQVTDRVSSRGGLSLITPLSSSTIGKNQLYL